MTTPPPNIRTLELLMKVRPAQLAQLLKRLLGVQRVEVTAESGCKYWVDPVSILGLNLLRDHRFEPPMTQLLERVLRRTDTFVDLGANEGYFSVLAARLAADGIVWSIEPQSRLHAVLDENARLNEAKNIRVEQLAISDGPGTIALHLRPTTNSGASSMFRYWRLGWSTEQVATTTLDAFFQDRGITDARLMKVDCEGAERLIFARATETLRRGTVACIALEYHPQIIGRDACRAIHQTIVDADYKLLTWNGLRLYCRDLSSFDLPGAEYAPQPF